MWGWRADFAALAGLGVLILVGVSAAVPESHPASAMTETRSSLGASLRAGLADWELLGVSLALALHSFGFYAYIATSSFVVEQEFGYPPSVFALVFGTNALAVLAGNVVFRRVVRRRHPSTPLGGGLAGVRGQRGGARRCGAAPWPAAAAVGPVDGLRGRGRVRAACRAQLGSAHRGG